ncbi:hypothetical protein Pmani_027640 [Petrolisthes manimaculis]|uniref:Uncharacterized protein n=1 Tax=Petrolisthes manimaculis TaxID=1843537 RepID=A0AAE1TWB8_9EUCA|nr:hypothetical protein Pmani_027640 [Petrolisthes manimaculis]
MLLVFPQETLGRTGCTGGSASGSTGCHVRRDGGSRLSLQQLRERSPFLDVPLINALFTDTSLTTHPSQPSPPHTNITTPSTQSDTPGQTSHGSPGLDTPEAAALVQSTHTKTRRRHKGSKTSRRYSLSGVYTTNQVPLTHIRTKCSSSKTFSGIHHHPNTTQHLDINTNTPPIHLDDPTHLKVTTTP